MSLIFVAQVDCQLPGRLPETLRRAGFQHTLTDSERENMSRQHVQVQGPQGASTKGLPDGATLRVFQCGQQPCRLAAMWSWCASMGGRRCIGLSSNRSCAALSCGTIAQVITTGQRTATGWEPGLGTGHSSCQVFARPILLLCQL